MNPTFGALKLKPKIKNYEKNLSFNSNVIYGYVIVRPEQH